MAIIKEEISARNIRIGMKLGFHAKEDAPASIDNASCNDLARKNTQATPTTVNVTMREYQRERGPSGPATKRSRASHPPCGAPQTTNVQLAPCHKPPSSIV